MKSSLSIFIILLDSCVWPLGECKSVQVHQQVANLDCLLFGSEQEVYSGCTCEKYFDYALDYIRNVKVVLTWYKLNN